MRHRIKKIPTLSKLNHKYNHLLHSDKSVALRFGPLSGRKLSNLQRPVLFSPEKRGFLEKMMSYVKQAVQTFTYFYSSKKDNKLNFLYSSKISTIPLVLSTFGLLLVLGCMISPNASILGVDKASAISEEECRGNTRVAMSLNGVSGDSVNLVNNNVSSDVTSNSLSKLSQDFNVIACNVKNYKLYVQAESSLLKNQSVPDALLPVGNNVDESAFPDNTWGYNISPTEAPTNTYNTMPDLSSTIPEAYVASKGTSYQGQDFTISFAAKFTDTKSAGHYTSDVLLSLVADPNITLSGIDTMQEMTPVICANSTEHETKQLIDVRDHKPYWVAKLKDGNCWMTQNLDLDLAGRTLTLADSDVKKDWASTTGDSELWLATDRNVVKYYNPGEYVEITPSLLDICGGMIEDRAGVESLGACAENGIKNVADLTPSNDPNFDEEIVDNTYNAHYSIGNYYSWAAMTANSVPGLNTSADESICARGWTLPNDHGEKGYMNLLSSYGYVWSELEVADQIRSLATLPGSEDSGGMHSYVTVAPMYFPHGGIVYDGRMYFVSSSGIFGTREFNSAGTGINYGAYRFDLYAAIAVYAHEALWDGLQVRCVAR